jgi:DNA-binding HxlR family transcriptional regulator
MCSDLAGGAKLIDIVLSHHNLLPQAIPRIALYAELLNAGIARSRLLGLRKSILYCHGHIHDDPIEVLMDPLNRGSQLILISAPTLSRGFNTITVEFGRRGFPLGCIVTAHRLSTRDGGVQHRFVRVPFRAPPIDTARRLGNEHVLEVIGSLQEGEVRFRDLQKRLQEANHRIQATTLAETLLEAEWLGCVALRNHEVEPEHWHIRRIV